MRPLRIERQEFKGLLIEWPQPSGQLLLPAELLRRHCPCAVCREKRGEGNHDHPLTPAKKKSRLEVISHSKEEVLGLEKIWSVGNYAIGIMWKDGHDDGIFTFELLSELTTIARSDLNNQ